MESEFNAKIKRCSVCGDFAICVNHHGLSCNPCRIFFNRNIARLSTLKCPKVNENCSIDFATRKCCAKCRLNKCLAIGMNKPVPKKLQIISNKFTTSCPTSNLNKTQLIRQNIPSTIDHLTVPFFKLELDTNEKDHIKMVQQALEMFPDETKLDVIGIAPNPKVILNLFALYIRRIVQFCKSVPGYKSLNSGDQLVILRQFFFEFMGVRIMFMYDFERQCYYSIANQSGNQAVLVTKDNLKCMKNISHFEEALKYGHAFHLGMDNDLVVRDLATILYLFQSRPNYSNPEYIRYQYCIYSYLLHRYFEHKYGCIEKANQKYASLLDSMATIGRVRQIFRMLFDEVGSDNLDRVIVESFDLNAN